MSLKFDYDTWSKAPFEYIGDLHQSFQSFVRQNELYTIFWYLHVVENCVIFMINKDYETIIENKCKYFNQRKEYGIKGDNSYMLVLYF